jgi:hypothetical protein
MFPAASRAEAKKRTVNVAFPGAEGEGEAMVIFRPEKQRKQIVQKIVKHCFYKYKS